MAGLEFSSREVLVRGDWVRLFGVSHELAPRHSASRAAAQTLKRLPEMSGKGSWDCQIGFVFSSRPTHQDSLRESARPPFAAIDSKGVDREAYDRQVVALLREHDVDLSCLAGYMRLLSGYFVREFQPHSEYPPFAPAGLPRPGRPVSGLGAWGENRRCTVHFVDEELDSGPIVLQAAVPVLDSDTPETLADRILAEEHRIYSEAISIVLEGKFRIEGRRVLRS